MNQMPLLLEVKSMLRSQGFDVWIFGGWAEELRGISRMRKHGDIDLLIKAEDFSQLDRFIESNAELQIIPQKSYSHKRAFYYKTVMIELFLITETPQGYFTKYFNHYSYMWPKHVFNELYLFEGKKLHVVSTDALFQYRNTYSVIQKARQKAGSTVFKLKQMLFKKYA